MLNRRQLLTGAAASALLTVVPVQAQMKNTIQREDVQPYVRTIHTNTEQRLVAADCIDGEWVLLFYDVPLPQGSIINMRPMTLWQIHVLRGVECQRIVPVRTDDHAFEGGNELFTYLGRVMRDVARDAGIRKIMYVGPIGLEVGKQEATGERFTNELVFGA